MTANGTPDGDGRVVALPRCPHCGQDTVRVFGEKIPWAACENCTAAGPGLEDHDDAEVIAAFTRPAHALSTAQAERDGYRKMLKACRNRIASDKGSEYPCCEGAVTGKDHTQLCDKFELISKIDAALSTAKQGDGT